MRFWACGGNAAKSSRIAASIAAVLASVVLLIAVINYANHLQSMSHLRQVMDEIASSADTEHGTGKRLAEGKALVGDG